jgi:hypothetical protein
LATQRLFEQASRDEVMGMSVVDRIRRALSGAADPADTEPLPRHERREAGRERHQETGEPAWEEEDRLDEPPGAGKRNPDAAPEVLGEI